MPSQRKSDTARANGAKSHGPVTLEGKARSSINSIRHGLTAKAVVLESESHEEFQALLESYLHQFRPATDVERELVQSLAVTRWRLNRIVGIETNMFSTELALGSDEADEALDNMEPDDHLAWAFQKLADNGKALTVLLRYEGALNRTYDRTFKQLQQLQAIRPAAALEQPNEPKPPRTEPRTRVSPRPFVPEIDPNLLVRNETDTQPAT